MAKRTGRVISRVSAQTTPRRPAFLGILETDQVRRITLDNRTLYAVPDVVSVLTQSDHPLDYWENLRRREPGLADVVQFAPFTSPAADSAEAILPAADLAGILRVVQSMGHPRAESLKYWLAVTGANRLEEAD